MSLEDVTPAKILSENRQLMLADVQKWISDIACQDLQSPQAIAQLIPMLLGLVSLRLGQLVNNQATGANYYRITPVTLKLEGQRIVERQTDGLVRTVLLFIDKASGGPTPTIRVSTSKGGAQTGGISVDAGQAHELGNVKADIELWASVYVSSNSAFTIPAYVIEFA